MDGVLHVSVNHQQVTRLATGIGADRPLWALIDVYGNTQSVQVTGDSESAAAGAAGTEKPGRSGGGDRNTRSVR